MKTFLIVFLLFISSFSYAQIKVEVKDFSDDYYAVISVPDTDAISKPGMVTVYNKKSGDKLIEVKFKGDALELRWGKIVDNVRELPYEKQSFIVYQDFNFDSVKEFALLDGFKGCNSLPSYQVFLADSGKFIPNPGLTELTQNYCGMFQVDNEKKIIRTMRKEENLWTEYSEHTFENDTLKLISITTEDYSISDRYVYIATQKLVDGKWTKTVSKKKVKDFYKENSQPK